MYTRRGEARRGEACRLHRRRRPRAHAPAAIVKLPEECDTLEEVLINESLSLELPLGGRIRGGGETRIDEDRELWDGIPGWRPVRRADIEAADSEPGRVAWLRPRDPAGLLERALSAGPSGCDNLFWQWYFI